MDSPLDTRSEDDQGLAHKGQAVSQSALVKLTIFSMLISAPAGWALITEPSWINEPSGWIILGIGALGALVWGNLLWMIPMALVVLFGKGVASGGDALSRASKRAGARAYEARMRRILQSEGDLVAGGLTVAPEAAEEGALSVADAPERDARS